MALFDVSLNNLKFPGVTNFDNQGIGVKLADGVSLSAAEASRNAWLPFFAQRSFEVSENSSTSSIERDCRFALTQPGLTFTLDTAVGAGIKVEIMGAFTGTSLSPSCTLVYPVSGGTATKVIYPGDDTTFASDADGNFYLLSSLEDGRIMNPVTEDVSHKAGEPRWLQFDFANSTHRGLKIRAGTRVSLDIEGESPHWLRASKDLTYDLNLNLAALVTSANLQAGLTPSGGAGTAADSSAYASGSDVKGQTVFVYLVKKVNFFFDTSLQKITQLEWAPGSDVEIVCSLNNTAPNDMLTPSYGLSSAGDGIESLYNITNSRKIGWFHTLCADTRTANQPLTAKIPARGFLISAPIQGNDILIKPYANSDYEKDFYNFYHKNIDAVTSASQESVVTVPHPLDNFKAGDILPESVFCLSFHPTTNKVHNFVYDRQTNMCVAIYLQGYGKINEQTDYIFAKSTSDSSYCVQTFRTASLHDNDALQVGCRLLYDHEFTSAALGSPEKVSCGSEAGAKRSTGGCTPNNKRIISAIGCESMVGCVWQYLSEYGPVGGSGFETYDVNAYFGKSYGVPYQLCAGGYWSLSSLSGSRSRRADISRSYMGDCGARACSGPSFS